MTEDTKTIYYNNGQLKFEVYKDDSGTHKNEWYKDGQIKFKKLNDPLVGVFDNSGKKFYIYEWHENGQKKKRYSSDESMVIWYENGQKKEEWFADNDVKKTFTQTKWYEDGTLSQIIKQSNDELDSLIETYHPNGKIKSKLWKYLIPPSRSDSWKKFGTDQEFWDKDGNSIPCPSMGVESYGDDIMDGLTDDEKELGSDFWNKIL